MRVLHLYSGNLYGGVERLLATMHRCREACAELSHAFALCFDGRLAEELRISGAEVHLLGPVRARQPWTIWQARWRLKALLSDTTRPPFDVAVTHACWPHAIFAPAIRRLRLPLVNWVHDVPKGTHWSERWASRSSPDLAIANSRCTQAAVPKLFPEAPTKVVHCAVPAPSADPAARDEVRTELATAASDVVILTASRLERLKGQDVLIKSLGHLRHLPNWTCWIAGGTQRPHEVDYLNELRRLAAHEGIESRVRFLGHRTDVNRLMAAADMHCQPNTGPEAFGLAFVEALYAGLPVVTSELGGAPEVVDESCGRLLPPGNVPALAATLRSLVTNQALRRQLGAGGPARALQLCDPAIVLGQLHGHLLALTDKFAVAEKRGLHHEGTKPLRTKALTD